MAARRERYRPMGNGNENGGQGHRHYVFADPPPCANFAEDRQNYDGPKLVEIWQAAAEPVPGAHR